MEGASKGLVVLRLLKERFGAASSCEPAARYEPHCEPRPARCISCRVSRHVMIVCTFGDAARIRIDIVVCNQTLRAEEPDGARPSEPAPLARSP